MKQPVQNPRFLVDLNVGRLAKWLRALGYDTLFPADHGDEELIRLALRGDRNLLTRDTHILQRRVAMQGRLKVLLVEGENVRDQLRHVLTRLGLQPEEESMFSLCIECNRQLEDKAKDEVKAQVPPYVFQTQEEFMECPNCRKIYWRGTHWSNMQLELQHLFHGEKH